LHFGIRNLSAFNQQDEMNLGRLFRIIGDRIGIVLLILAVTMLAAVAASFLVSKRYSTSTTIVIDFPASDPINGGSTYMAGTIPGYLATQVDLIKSDRVVSKVIDALGAPTGQLQEEWFKERDPSAGPSGDQDYRQWLATKLRREMSVEAARDSTFLTIGYESKSAEFAAKAANAFSQAYLAALLELKTEPAKNYSKLFEEQSKQYREDLAAAQDRLSKFQQKSGITVADERHDVENLRLEALSAQLAQVQQLASQSRSRLATAQRSGKDAMPEVMANQLIQSMKSEVTRVEARFRDESSRYGANHPQLLSTKAELESLRSRLAAETNGLAESIKADNSINEQQVGQVKAAYEAQRQKVLQLRSQRDQLALLQRDVDSAQKAYDLLSTRLMQTNLESAARLSNASIASRAVVPLLPSRPQPVLNLGLGAFFGLLLGIMAAIMAEGLRRPLRTSDDLLIAAGVPVLAVLPPASSRRTHRLIGGTGPTVGPSLRLGH
jgi:succinoglycan biosynthesis transport protein ExoP